MIDSAGDPKRFDDPSGENAGLKDEEIAYIVAGTLSLTFVLVLCLLFYVHNYRKFRYWLARHSNISYDPTRETRPGAPRRFANWFNAAFESLAEGARIPRDRLAERRDTFLRWFRHLAEGIRFLRLLREHWSRSNGRTEEVNPDDNLSGLHVEETQRDGADEANLSTSLTNQNVDLERQDSVDEMDRVLQGVDFVVNGNELKETKTKKKKKDLFADLASGKGRFSTPATSAEEEKAAMDLLSTSPVASHTRSATGAGPSLVTTARPVVPPPKVPAGQTRKPTRCCGVCQQVHEAGQECFVDLFREARLVDGGHDRETPNSRYDATAPPESLLGETPESAFKTAKQNLATKRRKVAERLAEAESSSPFSTDLNASEVAEDSLSQDTSARKILFDKTDDLSSQDEDSENSDDNGK